MPDTAREVSARGHLPERVLGWISHLSGLTLFCLMILVTVSVFFRYVLSSPLLGAEEITQIGMVFVVMLAMPHAAIRNKHIRVDIFDNQLGRFGRFVCDAVVRVISIVVLFLLVRKSLDRSLDAHEYGDVTNMIELPLSFAHGAITLGMGAYMLVIALQLYRQFRQGARHYD